MEISGKKTIGEELRAVRRSLSLSQVAFAERFGIPVGSLRRYETGETTPRGSALANVRQALTEARRPADRSLTRPEAAASLPILGDISAGHPLEPLVVIEDDQRRIHLPQSWLPRGPEAYFALVVNGSSMIGAGIEHGDLVVLEKTNHDVPVGRICAVRITGRGVTLRRVYPRKGGELRLTADNPAVPEITFGPEDDFEVVVLGQARWLFRGIGDEAVVLK